MRPAKERVVRDEVPEAKHGLRRKHGALCAELRDERGERPGVLEGGVRQEDGVDRTGDGAQRGHDGRVEGVRPAAVEEEAAVVDVEHVADGAGPRRRVERRQEHGNLVG